MGESAVGVTGSGDGYGAGYGDGSGSGYGYGDGSGSGYGSGYGYGYGSGYGYGYGSGELLISAYADHEKLASLNQPYRLGVWRSDAQGRPFNGGRSADPVYPGLVQEVPGPLRLCSPNALHATLRPERWKGDRWWVVALLGDVQQHDDKLGALRRLIVAEMA